MRMEIRSRRPIRADLRGSLVRRLRFVLGRFGSRVRSATVRLSEGSDAQGHAAKRCEIVVRLEFRRVVSVQDSGEDLPTAIDRATGRIARAAQRALTNPSGHAKSIR
jgi:hypothetical protein